MSEPFVIIDGLEYTVGDWVSDRRVTNVITPAVIEDTNVNIDDNSLTILMRSPEMRYYTISLMEFRQLVEDGIFQKMYKPIYYVGQVIKNRFTEKSLEIIDVPRVRNETSGEYAYYVLSFTPTFGFNHDVLKESEITQFYVVEGTVE